MLKDNSVKLLGRKRNTLALRSRISVQQFMRRKVTIIVYMYCLASLSTPPNSLFTKCMYEYLIMYYTVLQRKEAMSHNGYYGRRQMQMQRFVNITVLHTVRSVLGDNKYLKLKRKNL
jgi:hypothetical protein